MRIRVNSCGSYHTYLGNLSDIFVKILSITLKNVKTLKTCYNVHVDNFFTPCADVYGSMLYYN